MLKQLKLTKKTAGKKISARLKYPPAKPRRKMMRGHTSAMPGNGTFTQYPGVNGNMQDIFTLLRLAKAKEASDLHMAVGHPPIIRVHGSLIPVEGMPPLMPEDTERAVARLASAKDMANFQNNLEMDFGYTIPEIGRLRCNVARQRGTVSIAIRLLPGTIPGLEALKLPEICKDLVTRARGMVVVSGPTGSGKSTTLAAMLSYLNRIQARRIVTIEDPIEYLYHNDKCFITQRELGSDTLSFANGLKYALRQDVDAILVGEMRDMETAAAALNVAETGHLILTTGHAPSAYQAIERIIDLFPPHERNLAQARLASLLLGVLCQVLIPTLDGKGRVVAVEVMLANSAIKNLIREGKIHQLPNMIRTNSQSGMQLLDQALANLYSQRLISAENLIAYCNDRDEMQKLIADTRAKTVTEQPPIPSYPA